MVKRATYTVEQFVHDVQRILVEQGETVEAIWAIGPMMQRLAREGGDLWQVGDARLGRSGLAGRLLHNDDEGRLTFSLAQFAPGVPTPVHSHESWGAICLLSGRERYTSWRLVDDASRTGKAELAVVQDHHLEPGDLAYWFKAPYNLHRQWPGSEGCSEIVLLGGGGRRLFHYDLETGAIESAALNRR